MKIAQVAPLYESVPPKLYGGTERVVSWLTEELVAQGHEVTLFASGDSSTRARLVPACPRSLRLDPRCQDQLAYHILMLELVAREAASFDILHFHIDYLHFPISRRLGLPHLTTLHGRLDLPELVPMYQEFRGAPVVSISNAQRAPLPWLAYQATVYHGIPADLLALQPKPGEYLAFLGRASPEKGLHQAIDIAERAGVPLRIAAKIDAVDRAYFDQRIAPRLKSPHVEFLGEIGENEKGRFLGGALALLFPIDWPEPFGLVMVESMACGTPVIAYRRGSVAEILEEGVSGCIVTTFEDAVRAVERVRTMDRRRCREALLERFTAARMARDYLTLYERLLSSRRRPGLVR